MELQRERPPSYAQQQSRKLQDADSPLKLPSVPRHDISSLHSTSAAPSIHLPELRSLGLPDSNPTQQHKAPAAQWHPGHTGQLSASAFPAVPMGAPRASVEPPMGSPMATESIVSAEERGSGRAMSVMSMDDLETRMAAEALSGLRNPDLIRSPSARSTTLSIQQPSLPTFSPQQDEDPEPLLSLVTANHPWLGGTINGSLTAYNTTKYYSPSFVRSSAEFVERNIGSPIANTITTVSQRTGVEGGIRRYLGDRRLSDVERESSRKRKRLRESSPEKDVEKGIHSPILPPDRRSRAGSQASFAESLQSLPPYDDNKSPRYEELAPLMLQDQREEPQSPSRNWRTQLMITTSGLGAALSETSLRNLRLCLKLLRGATDHLTTMMLALKRLLEDYEESSHQAQGQQNSQQSSYTLPQEQEEASRRIAERIKAFHREIMQTLESVKNSISQYTGGALPENAGALVRRQLMSIPQRWRVAESTAEQQEQQNGTNAAAATPQNEAVRSGNKLVAFASQSLDMIAQVTLIVSATIENAEGWLDRMGRKRKEKDREMGQEQGQGEMKSPPLTVNMMSLQRQPLKSMYTISMAEKERERERDNEKGNWGTNQDMTMGEKR